MQFDLSLSPFGATVDQLVEAAHLAESEGFDGVWTYDHVSGSPAGATHTLDPWVTLTAIAAATDRIQLGPLVLNATIRHPAHIAVAAATLQQLSHGRLLLGLGAGAGRGRYASELAMVGLPTLGDAERRHRVEEVAKVIRALWSGTPDVVGEYHALASAEGFLRPEPVPPIIVGVNGPKLAAVAGRVADAVNIHSWDDLESIAEAARLAAGRDDFPITVEAPMTQQWLTGDGRDRLERLGTERVSYVWSIADGLTAIERAGKTISGT
ncbi:MAG: LLM class flavin-dependent oxidoreductase [Acidimicrobiia bacterium]